MQRVKSFALGAACAVTSLLPACALHAPPAQIEVTQANPVPTAQNLPAATRLKLSSDDKGFVACQVSRSCLTLDPRPFAPCQASEPCASAGNVVPAEAPGDARP
jgi:hypothetical protein